MDPRAPLLGLTALLATPLGLAAPLQDEVPYEDPLDMDDPWAPFPLPELDLPESAPGRGDGLLLVDGRRWEGPVEVGDFATWWFTPPDGTPRRVHGDAVVLAEFEGELDYRGPDAVLVAAGAKGKDLDVRELRMDLRRGLEQVILRDVDRYVRRELVEMLQQDARLQARAAAELDQACFLSDELGDLVDVVAHDAELCLGRVVLGQPRYRLKQLRAAFVIEVLRRDHLLGLAETLDDFV